MFALQLYSITLTPFACLCSSASDRGRFSYFGGRGGPLWQRISYKLPTPAASSTPPTQAGHPASDGSLEAGGQSDPSSHPNPPLAESETQPDTSHQTDMLQQLQGCDSRQNLTPSQHHEHHNHDSLSCQSDLKHGTLTVEDVDHHTLQHQISVWDYLKHQLQLHKLEITDETAQQLPFDFWGGFVGYLGYELKAECGGENAHEAPTPDAAMFLADRYVSALNEFIVLLHLHSCINFCIEHALQSVHN